MKRPPVIPINQFQLRVLLNDDQKEFFDAVIAEYVYCSHCRGICTEGIRIKEIFLTDLNDIHVYGICNTCKGKVSRIMEFGEDAAFYEKANNFRKSIKS